MCTHAHEHVLQLLPTTNIIGIDEDLSITDITSYVDSTLIFGHVSARIFDACCKSICYTSSYVLHLIHMYNVYVLTLLSTFSIYIAKHITNTSSSNV